MVFTFILVVMEDGDQCVGEREERGRESELLVGRMVVGTFY